MTNAQTIRTVFVLNRYHTNIDITRRIHHSEVSVGFDTNHLLNPSCNDQIFDTGWYECAQPLTGDVISVHRTSSEYDTYTLWSLRAYDGINVLQHATVFTEPTYAPGYSASNLLRMNPRVSVLGRTPLTGSVEPSCSKHIGQSGLTSVITFELANSYLVETILVLGNFQLADQISEFHLYVGYDSDYQNNTRCPGGPFAYPLTADYGTGGINTGTAWINGAEAWCNLMGNYVSFVREATANPSLSDISLCNFGVITKLCYTAVITPSSIGDLTFFLAKNKTDVVDFDSFVYSLASDCGDFEYDLHCAEIWSDVMTLD